MYAVIRTGGKQHKVKPGDIIEVESLHAEGDAVTFQPLLVVDDEGQTHAGKDLEKAVVTGKLLGEQKGDKVRVFKYKNKSANEPRQGPRQTLTLLEISEIKLATKKAPAKKETEPAEESAAAAE